MLYQIFEDLRVRSKGFCGIDRDVFVKYCPIPVSKFLYSIILVNNLLTLIFRVSGALAFIAR